MLPWTQLCSYSVFDWNGVCEFHDPSFQYDVFVIELGQPTSGPAHSRTVISCLNAAKPWYNLVSGLYDCLGPVGRVACILGSRQGLQGASGSLHSTHIAKLHVLQHTRTPDGGDFSLEGREHTINSDSQHMLVCTVVKC